MTSLGVSKYDKYKGHRKIEQQFRLEQGKDVKALLRKSQELYEWAMRSGDYAIIDVLVDVGKAMRISGMTERQKECIVLHLILDMKEADVAEILGITQPLVSQSVNSGCNKIAQVFRAWQYTERADG